ncbi:peptidase S64 [Suhomyces tanzawaensis NRRL Y-17324]|uniref:Peptidase S64 n=1 Tax=Suhomyces tanzawaensis NRRL Y-17324 TaxID=984487 RepID=A0A1E4SLC3_9ASCO|nr:peptidase S64 [Suhomyces tanzawaensis NRRL Y-17324]ODV80290.1 peptidase S64 [Suhomyces tanzawaensis NRRL Y-17324]
MSMKRFLSRGSKDDKEKSKERTSSTGGSDNQEIAPVASGNTEGSRDSITEMYPMFEGLSADDSLKGPQKFSFTNDPKLANPSILSKPASVFTKDSDYMGKSIFSKSRKTFSTKQSSFGASSDQGGKKDSSTSFTYSQPLQILNMPEESTQDAHNKPPHESIADKLQQLYDDLAFIIHQFDNSIINLTTAVINSIDCFKKFIAYVEDLKISKPEAEWRFTTYNNSNLRKIMKMYLHFYDNLLKDEVYIKLKLLLVKNFNDFSLSLNSNVTEHDAPQSIVKPQNFAIGINQGLSLPNEDVLTRIIEKISKTFVSLKEQNGSFIAPIARGISNDLHILCLYFGYPNPTDYHVKLTQSLHGLYDDIHIIVMKNQIDLASTTETPVSKFAHLKSYKATNPVTPEISTTQPSFVQPTNPQKFKLPFRIPTDSQRPPISLSLSIENSVRTSGTLGGYIYPIIDLKKQPHLESYTNSKFALSCGHVCLDTTTGSTTTEYPHVSAPLSVLIKLYKQALIAQYQKVMSSNNGSDDILIAESRAAYGSVIKQVEEMFPLKRVKIKDPKTKQEGYELRNLPQTRFGQIIWGERTLVDLKKGEKDTERKLSDLAIIKVNKNLICDQNYLGDDIPFNEFDPALMFDNLYVRKVIDLERHSPRTMDLNVDEVDEDLPIDHNPDTYNGLPVFKYGSTTKFTKGNLNGIKLVYWLDGAIHSSEFIVNSIENNSAFAAGGDSGSWILTKLEDIEQNAKGLGVVGILHSYDGEFKQFGLYTPMCEILTRLKEVTGIKWGVVGVTPEKGEEYDSEADLSSDADSTYSDEADSDFEDEAYPPEVD